jgi:hypothetical protein
MIAPPVWTSTQLDELRARAIKQFRKIRMEEPLEEYLEAFDRYQGHLEELLETTTDLLRLSKEAKKVLLSHDLLAALLYLPGPPISKDDLMTLAQAKLSPGALKSDTKMVKRVLEVIMLGLDRRRFVWVAENREPSESERNAAIQASSALMAAQRVATSRRHKGKTEQEELVEESLLRLRLTKVASRSVDTLSEAPQPGEFCRESRLGNRKADFLVGLWDKRTLAIECKVSNSSTNSIKRLNNDAAAKAVAWRKDFGDRQVVPCAVLSGVYKLRNLEDAQNRGLTLFWAHDLGSLNNFIDSTK